MSQKPAPPGRFVPAHPPLVVYDTQLAGAPVLMLGWWLSPSGAVVSVEVGTFTSTRRPFDIGAFPSPPRAPYPDAPAMLPQVHHG